MNQHDNPTLGISIGTRIIGIAIIKEKELLQWQTRRLRHTWSQKKCALLIAVFDQLVRRYDIAAIGIKVPPRGHFSHGLTDLVSALTTYAKAKGMPLQSYRIQELKQMCSQQSLNRKGMMQCITQRFAFLQSHYQQELQNRHGYHVKMFEAILAALCMQSHMKYGRNRKTTSFL